MPTRQGRLAARQTHPLVWLVATVCTIVVIAIIIAGLAILVGYLILRPKLPYIHTTYAHLDTLNYSQYGKLDVQIALHITAVNNNRRVHAAFSNLKFFLLFYGVPIAQLQADSFDVAKNSTFTLPYVIRSSSIPLDARAIQELEASLKQYKVSFNLKGDVRTRWKVGIIGYVKFWVHSSCQLIFSTNGSSINSDCSSKSA